MTCIVLRSFGSWHLVVIVPQRWYVEKFLGAFRTDAATKICEQYTT